MHAYSSHVVITSSSSPAMVIEPVVAEWLYENHHGREEVVHLDARACLPSCLSYS